MVLLVFYVLFLTLNICHSSALYCLCKDGVDDQALQKAIENACWFGADCASIEPNGACYTPNTLKDHCNYVVNSYYQRMRNAGGTCDFAGVATTSSTPPSTTSGCVYPSDPSNAGKAPLPPPISLCNNGTTTVLTGCTSNSGSVVAHLQGTKTKLLLTQLVLTTVWLALIRG